MGYLEVPAIFCEEVCQRECIGRHDVVMAARALADNAAVGARCDRIEDAVLGIGSFVEGLQMGEQVRLGSVFIWV